MSLDKFNLVVSALENESQKRHWTFRRLHRDDMPNPSNMG